MTSRIDDAQVRRIAALAHLTLSDDEVAGLAADMSAILDYATAVNAVDTQGVPPTSHPLGGAAAWREDNAVSSMDRATALTASADADTAAGLFRVPRVIQRDE